MIHKYILKAEKDYDSKFIKDYLKTLPDFLINKINSYTSVEKKLQRIMGLQLIEKMILENNLSQIDNNLSNLKFSYLGKPYFNDTLNFNLSYSVNYAVLAFSEKRKIGIDIEHIKLINLREFKDYCTENEYNKLDISQNLFSDFCKLWTRKEALSKAIGKGVFLDFNSFDVENDIILCENSKWELSSELFENEFWITTAVEM